MDKDRLFKRIIAFLRKSYNPRYQLILIDKKIIDNDCVYIFNLHGSHEFFELTYSDIVNNECFLTLIHPKNLLLIEKENSKLKIQNKKLSIYSEKGRNEYEIKNKYNKFTYSGDYIIKNIDHFFDLDIKDAVLIAYNTGLDNGRNISKKLYSEINLLKTKSREENKNNVINLKN